MSPTPAAILEYLGEKRISIWAVARKMQTDSGHLRRVLMGRRRGSDALLAAIWETAQGMPGRPRRRQDDLHRLVRAAVHVFFVQRGDFDSAIFDEPEDQRLYGPGRNRARRPAVKIPERQRNRRLAHRRKNRPGHHAGLKENQPQSK